MILLSTAYFGNIEYYSKLLGKEPCTIDTMESYTKQSYRNRCDILGANGLISLSVPIIKHHNNKIFTRYAEIDYATKWQHQHWLSITSAYSSSPFFEYYADDFTPFFERKERYLVDLNNLLQSKVLELLNVSPQVQYASDYIDISKNNATDFRNSISPKKRLNNLKEPYVAKEYYQVFCNKTPFCPNLSIIDLLFCEGPEAKKYIK